MRTSRVFNILKVSVKPGFSFLFFLLLICIGDFSKAASTKELCASGVEGGYRGKLGDLSVRLNLFCLEDGRMLANFGEQGPSVAVVQNLGQSAADEDTLYLASFPLENPDRQGISSKSTMAYMKLDIVQLKQGNMLGVYTNGNLDHFIKVDAKRNQIFPRWKCDPSRGVLPKLVNGSFAFISPILGSGRLLVDILYGTPTLNLVLSGLPGVHTMDGPLWDGSGCFSSYTAQGDGEADARAMIFIRGFWIDAQHIEFYWVSPQGQVGPLAGVRD